MLPEGYRSQQPLSNVPPLLQVPADLTGVMIIVTLVVVGTITKSPATITITWEQTSLVHQWDGPCNASVVVLISYSSVMQVLLMRY